MILLINSEVANIGSWENILREKKIEYLLSNDPSVNLDKVTKVIFPGIGNFSQVMLNLERLDLKNKLIYLIKKDKPYLGICVGMQVLFDKSEEEEGSCGLKVFEGKCLEIQANTVPKPHNGWNNIVLCNHSNLFREFDFKSDLYFNHSYYCCPNNKDIITSFLEDDNRIITSVQKKNIYGVQFHPEKSQIAGNLIINNFLNL